MYQITMSLNTWASDKFAAYLFTDAVLPLSARVINLSRVDGWLRRLEAWLHDRQLPECPF